MFDKTPLKSKKFLAYLLAELSSKSLMAYLITHIKTIELYEMTVLLAIIISSATLTIGYILGQAALDKYLSAAVDILDKEKKDEKS